MAAGQKTRLTGVGAGATVAAACRNEGVGDARSRTEGVLAAWLNQLPETQGVSLGPWDRVRIDQYPRRRARTGRAAAPRRALDPGAVARRRLCLRPEHRAGRRFPEA